MISNIGMDQQDGRIKYCERKFIAIMQAYLDKTTLELIELQRYDFVSTMFLKK